MDVDATMDDERGSPTELAESEGEQNNMDVQGVEGNRKRVRDAKTTPPSA